MNPPESIQARPMTERNVGERHLEEDATTERALQVRRIMNESLRQRTPQERDRMMQVHMAQARGATANAFLLRHAMNFAIRLRETQTGTDLDDLTRLRDEAGI